METDLTLSKAIFAVMDTGTSFEEGSNLQYTRFSWLIPPAFKFRDRGLVTVGIFWGYLGLETYVRAEDSTGRLGHLIFSLALILIGIREAMSEGVCLFHR